MGSPNGIWTAVSGGMAQSQNLDIIANNLANVNTTGFKKDTPTFKEYLTVAERPVSAEIDIPRTIFKDSDFYHTDGKEHAMVNVDKVHTDHSQSQLKATNGPFDMAIDGPGFFAIQTPSGVMYSRAGDFKVNGQGQLVTTDGFPVLALSDAAIQAKKDAATQQSGGAPDPARGPASVNPFSVQQNANAQPQLLPINLKDALSQGHKLHISNEGQIYSGEQLINTLAIAEFSDVRMLKKVSSTMYSNPNPANVATAGNLSRVHQGFLEQSNVNPVSELVEMLKANRMYESNMRAIKAYNDMAGKEANEVGKL
jgi:flagellar basal-body rod protein FlgF